MTGISSTAIDLSRLPAPTFVAPQSYEATLAEITARMVELMPEFDATIDSDPAVKVFQVMAWFTSLLRQQGNDNSVKSMLAYAEKADLDQLGANLNVARLVLDPGDPDQGIDPIIESDDDFRARIQLAPESLSVAGPATAYEFHARSTDASIADARASSPSPGVVLVSLLSRVGTGTASAEQIEAVEDVLGAGTRALRPLTDNVIVQSVEIIAYEIEAELTLFEGPDEVPVLTAAQEALERYKADCRRIGRDVNRAGIFHALKAEGVSNVRVIRPAADLVISDTQCSNCVGTNVRVVARGE